MEANTTESNIPIWLAYGARKTNIIVIKMHKLTTARIRCAVRQTVVIKLDQNTKQIKQRYVCVQELRIQIQED